MATCAVKQPGAHLEYRSVRKMSIPTKTYPDATMSLAGPDAHADNVNVGIACQENRLFAFGRGVPL
jgi:hypothetical protein